MYHHQKHTVTCAVNSHGLGGTGAMIIIMRLCVVLVMLTLRSVCDEMLFLPPPCQDSCYQTHLQEVHMST